MKQFLLLFFVLSSFSALAASPCKSGELTCSKDTKWFSNQGTYFAVGVSKSSCNQAAQAAQYRLAEKFSQLLCKDCGEGNTVIRCGAINGRPYLWRQSCQKNSRGHHVAWVQCDNFRSSRRIPSPSNPKGCAMVGGVLMCGR